MYSSPCIMCVQYFGGCSVHWGGGIQYNGGGIQYNGGRYSVQRGDTMSTSRGTEGSG